MGRVRGTRASFMARSALRLPSGYSVAGSAQSHNPKVVHPLVQWFLSMTIDFTNFRRLFDHHVPSLLQREALAVSKVAAVVAFWTRNLGSGEALAARVTIVQLARAFDKYSRRPRFELIWERSLKRYVEILRSIFLDVSVSLHSATGMHLAVPAPWR